MLKRKRFLYNYLITVGLKVTNSTFDLQHKMAPDLRLRQNSPQSCIKRSDKKSFCTSLFILFFP